MSFYRMGQPDLVFAERETGWTKLTKERDNTWVNKDVAVYFAADLTGNIADLLLHAEKSALKTIKLRWHLRLTGPLQILGDHWERGYGDLEWRGIAAERIMPWYFLLNDGSKTDGFGVSTGPSAFCYWQADNDGITFTADVRNGGLGVLLGERTLKAAQLRFHEGKADESPFASAVRFCSDMCEKPLMPSHPVYGGNNWYYAYGNSTHEEILEDSRFMASLSDSRDNRPYMVIDDGWQLTSGNGACNGGPWVGNAKFPDMERLAGQMKEEGVRPGIWCRPLLHSGVVPEEWIRYESGGGHVLDPTVPDVLEMVSHSIATMSRWGYDLIKHDFTTYDLLGKWGFEMKSQVTSINKPFMDRSKTTAEIVMTLYQTIAEASGSSLLIGCNTVSHMAAGLFEIQRTGDDTSGKAWERTRYMGVNTLAFRMPQHGTFYSHDADCAGLTSQVPWELNKQWLELLAGSGTPLFVSVAPNSMSKEQEKALRDAFHIASRPLPVAEPLDWMETTSPKRWLMNGKEVEFAWNDVAASIGSHGDNHWWLGE